METGRTRGSCFILFQDIIEPIQACTYTRNRDRDLQHPHVFFLWSRLGNILGISLNIDCVEKAPAGFRFTFSAFSAMSSNYHNELWRSSGTQTPREISIMSSMHGRDSSAEADSFKEGLE